MSTRLSKGVRNFFLLVGIYVLCWSLFILASFGIFFGILRLWTMLGG